MRVTKERGRGGGRERETNMRASACNSAREEGNSDLISPDNLRIVSLPPLILPLTLPTVSNTIPSLPPHTASLPPCPVSLPPLTTVSNTVPSLPRRVSSLPSCAVSLPPLPTACDTLPMVLPTTTTPPPPTFPNTGRSLAMGVHAPSGGGVSPPLEKNRVRVHMCWCVCV